MARAAPTDQGVSVTSPDAWSSGVAAVARLTVQPDERHVLDLAGPVGVDRAGHEGEQGRAVASSERAAVGVRF